MEHQTKNTQRIVAVAVMIGCLLLVGQADAYTKIVSPDYIRDDAVAYVPQHEDFLLQCVTVSQTIPTGSTEFRHKLFQRVGDGTVWVDTDPKDGCETVVEHSVHSNTTHATVNKLFTIFRLKAEEAGSLTYGCLLEAKDAPNNTLHTSYKNVTMVVCPEPKFSLSIEEGNSQSVGHRDDEGNTVILNTKEKCNFHGAVSYFVNGVSVPQMMSSGEAPSPQVVERDDSSLEIRSPVCVGHQVCNVSARFSYIFEEKIKTSLSDMLVNGCCIDDGTPTTEMPTKATASSLLSRLATMATTKLSVGVMESIRNGSMEAKRQELEIEKLKLEIGVLRLKTELIPLQIIGRQNRLSDSDKKQSLEDEEDTTSLPM